MCIRDRHPTALLLSACMMLDYLKEEETASRIRTAVDEVLKEAVSLTPDLHGTATTQQFRDAIIEHLL